MNKYTKFSGKNPKFSIVSQILKLYMRGQIRNVRSAMKSFSGRSNPAQVALGYRFPGAVNLGPACAGRVQSFPVWHTVLILATQKGTEVGVVHPYPRTFTKHSRFTRSPAIARGASSSSFGNRAQISGNPRYFQ